MLVTLAFTLSLVFVILTFGVLPFLNYFVFPLNKKNRLQEVDGKIELNANLSKAFSSVSIEEYDVVLKKNEGVQRVQVVLFYKRGILTLRKYYYLEIAGDEVAIPKLSKGQLFKIVVSSVDGVSSYKGIAYGISMPIFIITTILQFLSMFTFTLLLAIGFDYLLSANYPGNYIYYFARSVSIAPEQIYHFYLWPIVVSILIPAFALLVQVVAIKGKLIKKEVK